MRVSVWPLWLVCLWWSSPKAAGVEVLDPNDLTIRLTAERGGPPLGAAFVPIPVVNLPQFAPRPNFGRPLKGRPPPPPPISPPTRRPTVRPPRPLPPKPVAPPSLPVPLPANNTIPQQVVETVVPPLPQSVAIGQLPPVLSPALEPVPVTQAPVVTTTPGDRDYRPAIYQRFQQNDDHSYYFDFLAENTISRREQGFFKDGGLDLPRILVQTGTFSYTSPEGQPYRVDYVADERGFRVFPSLPTA